MRNNIYGIVAVVVLLLAAESLSAQPLLPITLRSYLERNLQTKNSKVKFTDICPIDSDAIAFRVFSEYGAMFAADKTKFPMKCLFEGPIEVDAYHKELETKEIVVSGVAVELQRAAAEALYKAIDEANGAGKRITPLDGAIAGKRNFQDTLRIWNSRFWPALDHWVLRQGIDRREAEAVIGMPIKKQVAKVIEWESKGYYFSTRFSKSIFYSVAPPGSSQHLSLIAFDVVEASDQTVRKILNKHGWFQTIKTDEPHFTYLGTAESELPFRGLKQFTRGGHTFWIPNM